MDRRQFNLFLGAAASAASLGWAGTATAQSRYPARPIRLVVAAPAGSPIDVIARKLSPRLAERFGVAAVVDNKPGAGGAVAVADILSSAGAEGYSLLLSTDLVLTAPLLVKGTQYDPLKDLRYLVTVADAGMLIVASPSLKERSMETLIASMKKSGKEIDYGSWGPGTSPVRLMASLSKKAGVAFREVPYKGSPPAIQDVLAGQIPLTMTGIVTAAPLIASGKLHPLAYVSDKRSPLLPEVPTLREMGYTDPIFSEKAWVGVVANAKVPAAIAKTVQDHFLAVLKNPDATRFLPEIGFDLQALPGAEFTTNVTKQFEAIKRLYAELHIESQ